jgi:hypothetical protein
MMWSNCSSAWAPRATVPQPDHLLHVVRDHIPPPGLFLWLHVHANQGLRTLDPASLTLLPRH